MIVQVPFVHRIKAYFQGEHGLILRRIQATANVDIAEIDASEAPIAVRWRDDQGREFEMRSREGRWLEKSRLYHAGGNGERGWRDCVHRELRTIEDAYLTSSMHPKVYRGDRLRHDPLPEGDPSVKRIVASDAEPRLILIAKAAANSAVIDGEIWQESQEPAWMLDPQRSFEDVASGLVHIVDTDPEDWYVPIPLDRFDLVERVLTATGTHPQVRGCEILFLAADAPVSGPVDLLIGKVEHLRLRTATRNDGSSAGWARLQDALRSRRGCRLLRIRQPIFRFPRHDPYAERSRRRGAGFTCPNASSAPGGRRGRDPVRRALAQSRSRPGLASFTVLRHGRTRRICP